MGYTQIGTAVRDVGFSQNLGMGYTIPVLKDITKYFTSSYHTFKIYLMHTRHLVRISAITSSGTGAPPGVDITLLD